MPLEMMYSLQGNSRYVLRDKPFPPRFKAVVLMKNGVVKTVSHAKKKPIAIPTPNVWLLKWVEAISPAVTQLSGPMVAE